MLLVGWCRNRLVFLDIDGICLWMSPAVRCRPLLLDNPGYHLPGDPLRICKSATVPWRKIEEGTKYRKRKGGIYRFSEGPLLLLVTTRSSLSDVQFGQPVSRPDSRS